jgi:exopolysaccharide biosynthesis protein
MRRFLNKSLWWPVVYTLVLAGFAVFVVLDAFLIPQAMRTVPDTASAQSDNGTEETISDVDVVDGNDAAGNATAGVYTANSYVDANISIAITTERLYNTQVYIADIQLQSIEYLKTAFAQNTYGRNIYQKTSAMAEAHNAILAINGDYCGYRNAGFVVRNGILCRSSSSGRQALVICQDGSFEVVSESTADAEALVEQGAIQVFSFGPSLVLNGEINVAADKVRNPRTAIGIISPLHYVMIVADGRTGDSSGLTLYQLATILQDLGCETAYNLDGGGSSTMWFNGQLVNVPTDGRTVGERRVSDIVYIGY